MFFPVGYADIGCGSCGECFYSKKDERGKKKR